MMNPLPFQTPWLMTTAQVFADAAAPLYAVGGVVRNAIMGLPASDIDVCGPLRPEQVLRLCEGTPVRAVLRAAHFGTVELHVADGEGRHMAEYTTFRMDSYRCGHQPDVVHFADTPEADALRRDFSVNALYRLLLPDPVAEPPVLDPTGGLEHLRRGILHTVTADPAQVLKDDGLRILRAARFQAELGLTPTDALLDAAARFAPLLADIAMERLREELTKLLLSDTRYPTLPRHTLPVAAGLNTVRRVNAWPYLFGVMLPNADAIDAMSAYCSPEGMPAVSGKLALLFFRETPDALTEQMHLLRYSIRETEAAANALTATRRIITGDCHLMDAIRLGLPAMRHAHACLLALQGINTVYGCALERAQALLTDLRREGLPLTLRALAIHGDDLLPLCRAVDAPVRCIGDILDMLWQAVAEQKLPNDKAALVTETKAWLAKREQP